MLTIRNARKTLSLFFAIILLAVTIFLSIVGNVALELTQNLEDLNIYSEQQREVFLRNAMDTQKLFITAIETSWITQRQDFDFMSYENFKSRFFSNYLSEVINPAFSSMTIAVSDGERIVYREEQESIYDQYIHIFEEELVLADGQNYTFNINDEETIHYVGVSLTYEDRVLYVYMFFEEQILHQEMLDTLSPDIFRELSSNVNTVLYLSGIFLIFTLFFGTFLILYLKQLQLNMNKNLCPYYGKGGCFYNNERYHTGDY